MNKKFLSSLIAGVLVIGGVFTIFKSTERIKAGYVGVVYSMNGGVEDKTLSQGWHLISPFKKVVEYSVATEQAFLSKDKKEGSEDDDSFLIPSKDGKTLSVDMEFSYHFDNDKLPQTFTRFKGQKGKVIEQNFIKGKMKAYATEVSSKFSVLDIYGEKRSNLNKELYEYSKGKFKEYGIIIDSVNFTRINVDGQTNKAIQDRINAQQQLEKQKIELETAKIKAQKDKVDAESKAKVTEIGAKAEADANKLKQSTLNNTIVEYEKVKKWDGKVPQVQGGNPILDMRTNK
ncbi:prohibitin family protein [Clostridium botulinum]|uniref:prohibitin family protein n=1 Tax=Clostridium botulinum TaxID=1491 RepID=UPI0013760FB3|nr:prohibitin family protein [Clostridium botulinum]NCI19688.1 prohibitin family protein [Clostridium botulinum]NCI35726.1 prohibitin family protein [Clostridium botulinum]NCI71583.1 prohibitin family protein [Clostridium botulinum]NDI38775.1 prohibitin family protein [Clostridium botulinum]